MRKIRMIILCLLLFAVVLPLTVLPEKTDQGISFIDVGGVKLNYLEKGDREPILLLHGWRGSIYTWQYIIDHLAESHRVLALDLKGRGDSEKPTDHDYSPEELRDEIIQFLDILKIKSATLAGSSLGGRLALEVALDAPERVNQLILIDSAGYPLDAPFYTNCAVLPVSRNIISCMWGRYATRKMLEKAYFNEGLVTDDVVDGWHRPTGDKGYFTAVRKMWDWGIKGFENPDVLREINLPTLIIWGREDEVIPVEHAYRFQQAIPGSQLAIIPLCGHIPSEEKPEEVSSLIIQFLETGKVPSRD